MVDRVVTALNRLNVGLRNMSDQRLGCLYRPLSVPRLMTGLPPKLQIGHCHSQIR